MELQTTPPCDLCFKISRLIQKHGWNLEDFARKAKLNRHTVRKILRGTPHRLRRATLSACASALGLTVSELREHSLEVLLTRVNNQEADKSGSSVLRRYETASQPELQAWLERHRDRAKKLDAEEMYELLSLQGVGGPLTETGVEHFIAQIERRRELVHKVRTIAGTDMADVLEKLVDLIYERIQPYADRK